jgi:hypothetical protein
VIVDQAFSSKTSKLLQLVAEEGQRPGHILYGRELISQEQLEETVEKTKGKKARGGGVT